MQILTLHWYLHGWSRSDILALAGVIVTLLVAVMPPVRHWLFRQWHVITMRAGFSRRRYTRWFVQEWGNYDNPYLDDTENLDLNSTYVSLSFHSEKDDMEIRSIATQVLANRNMGNLVIEGAPGSGKTTLLRAYGVGVCRPHTGRFRRDINNVPFLVQLRKFAKTAAMPSSLTRYLIDDILVSGMGMSDEQAERFMRFVLSQGRLLVMLDGLDEVSGDHYRATLEAIHEFVNDHNPDHPTHLARVILSCRRQNFISIRDEWVPAIAQQVCTLAPLRNSEIFNYLNKLRSKFKTADGPENFIQAVRASGTLDLHRIPLILAMSVGLYARKDYFEIPSSIARLYRAMIEEMLDRHRFRQDPGGWDPLFPAR